MGQGGAMPSKLYRGFNFRFLSGKFGPESCSIIAAQSTCTSWVQIHRNVTVHSGTEVGVQSIAKPLTWGRR